MLGKGKGELVKVIIGNKVWQITRRMANSIIELAKNDYRSKGVNAIVAVEKERTIVLQKDVFDDTEAFVKAISNWEHGGYKCYYAGKK